MIVRVVGPRKRDTVPRMAIVLHHHPWSRAANVVWMLEEVGVDYRIEHVDIMKGAQKAPELVALNPMGKLPVLVDGDAVVTESAAIALYLADRYAPNVLAPAVDAPSRSTYLRWTLFAPSVIEPGVMARANGWTYKASQAGWGEWEAMLAAMESAIARGPFVLGDRFSMADVVFGGTLRYMLMVKSLEPRPTFAAYVERLAERPACRRADAKNADIAKAHGL